MSIIEIFSKGRDGPGTDHGDVSVTREHSTEHGNWSASHKSPEGPWVVSIWASRLPWITAAKPLIEALLEAGRHVWVKIQAPEKLEGGQVARGFCSTMQGGKVVEGPWEATRITGESWSIQFKENPPEPWLKNEVATFIEAILNAAQAN